MYSIKSNLFFKMKLLYSRSYLKKLTLNIWKRIRNSIEKEKMKVINFDEANQFVKRISREG